MRHLATMPGPVIWMTATKYGIIVYYLNPKNGGNSGSRKLPARMYVRMGT